MEADHGSPAAEDAECLSRVPPSDSIRTLGWACALGNESRESHAIRKAVRRGSEGGRWKSTHKGNSLAAYPTACPVWEGLHLDSLLKERNYDMSLLHSVGKLCQRNERGVQDAPSPAGCRFSVHLPVSACICGHLPASGRCLIAIHQVPRTGILFHLRGSAGSLLMKRVMSEARDFSTIFALNCCFTLHFLKNFLTLIISTAISQNKLIVI